MQSGVDIAAMSADVNTGWIAVASDQAAELNVRRLLHGVKHPSIADTVRNLLSIFAADYPALDHYLGSAITQVSANFVTGCGRL
jgi:hypothetical protein